MSTLRISNIEAKSVPASATVDEKVKITNSSGDTLVFIDGKTSGITTVGINTTDGNITFDANSNIVVTGIITATKFVGTIEPTELTVSGNVSVGGSVTAATFYGSGANLTGITSPAITSIASDGAARVLTSDGDGTATAHSFVTIESNRLSINRGTGTGAFPLIVRRTDASGIVAEFSNSGGYGVYLGQNGATGEAYIRSATGQDMVFTTNAGSGIANERLRLLSGGNVRIQNQLTFAGDGHTRGIKLGADGDVNLYHDNSDAYFDNDTGDFYIRNAGSNPNQIFIQGKGGENSIVVNGDGMVEMFYDNSRKFFTQSLGVTVESYGNTPTVQFMGASNLNLGKIDVDQFVSNNSIMRFFTLASGSQNEAMRILDIGSVLIGCTTQANTGSYFQADNNDRRTLNVCSSSTATQNQILLRNPNGRVGSIQTSGSSTSFNTTFSDIASKKNFENWNEDVLSLFKNINPQKFNFKVEDDSVPKSKGFIAQDMIDKFPEAYQKQEDELYMFNPSGIVVYLMKGIKELITKNDALEERIKNLEGS